MNKMQAIKKLKRYLLAMDGDFPYDKMEDVDLEKNAEKYLNAAYINALVYIGDSFDAIAKSLNPDMERSYSDDERVAIGSLGKDEE